MSDKEKYEYLADEKKISVGYAIMFAINEDNLLCWEIVLSRKDVPNEAAVELVTLLENRPLTLHILKREGMPADKIVNTIAFLYDSEENWKEILLLPSIQDYLKSLSTEDFLHFYGSVKSRYFWAEVEKLNPNLKCEKCSK